MKSRGIISEEYVYHGVHYILYFNDNDTSSTPNNETTADSLIDALGSNEYTIAYYEDYPALTFIEDVTTGEESDSTLSAWSPNACLYVEYFADANFQGASFCVDNQFDIHEVLVANNAICAELIAESNLANRSYGQGQSWNDRISSIKIYRDGASKTSYDNAGFTGNGTMVTITLFRGANLPISFCDRTKWVMRLRGHGTTESAWEVPNLKKERWGFLCTNMNDKASSLAVSACKCSAPCYNF